MEHFINVFFHSALLRRYRANLTRTVLWLQLWVTSGLSAQPRLLMVSHTQHCDHSAVLCTVMSPPCCPVLRRGCLYGAAILGIFKVDFKGLIKPPLTSPDHADFFL